MHIAVVCLTFSVFTLSCVAQQKLKLDTDSLSQKTYPAAISGTGHSAAYPPRPQDLYWQVDLLPPTEGLSGNLMLKVNLENVSKLTLPVPISQDGIKAVKDCPDHMVLEAHIYIGKQNDYSYMLQVGEFWGCQELPATIIYLKPGEWISFVKKVPADRLPNEVRAEMSLSRIKYLESAGGLTRDEIDSTFRSSPWQAISKAAKQ